MNKQNGFTLIEVIVYLALFSMLFGGVVLASYNIIESTGRNQAKAMTQEEGDFLISKINWALSGISGISSPSSSSTSCDTGISSNSLIVSKYNPPIANPIAIGLSGTDMTITEGNNPSSVLNNSSVQVKNLSFIHIVASGDGITPESACSSFTLDVKTPSGQTYSQDFSTVSYLRK